MKLPADATSLPVFSALGKIVDSLCREGRLGLSAEAGAGKSTLVPWAMLEDPRFSGGRIWHVLPRRLAVVALAERIAQLRRERVGDAVGYRIREVVCTGPDTRLEIMTLGVALRMIQADPTLSGVSCVILDEFHERHWQGDLLWAFLQQVRAEVRPDLRVLVCSTNLPETLDAPRVSVSGRQFPVETVYRAPPERERVAQTTARAVEECLARMDAGGCLLAFLPGWAEIAACLDTLKGRLPPDVELYGLHRASDAAVRQAVFSPVPPSRRRVVAATNIAETSLTLPGVVQVVDSGLERRFVFLPRTGLVHRQTVRISRVSAVQRTGRAGRLRPGRALRLWAESEKLEEFARPEILEADPVPVELELALWGEGAQAYFLDAPPAALRASAAGQLRELGMLDEAGRPTPRGQKAAHLGVHPRLAAMLLSAGESGRKDLQATACLLAALLEEDVWRPASDPDCVSDWLRSWLQKPRDARVEQAVLRVARTGGLHYARQDVDPSLCAGLLCMAYPDRIGRVDESGARVKLVSGRAARISPLPPGTLVTAPFVDGGETTGRVQLFEPCTLEHVTAGGRRMEVREFIDFKGFSVQGRTQVLLGRIILEERVAPPGDEALQRALREKLAGMPPSAYLGGPRTQALRLRIRLAAQGTPDLNWPAVDDDALTASLDAWLLPHVRYVFGDVLDDERVAQALWNSLDGRQKNALRETAPETLTLPSGRRVRVDYSDGRRPRISSRLQDFFGCRATPRIGGEPVVVELLSPAGRPIQVTSDLEGFWKNSYPLVRKEMAGRYPKHPWPKDP